MSIQTKVAAPVCVALSGLATACSSSWGGNAGIQRCGLTGRYPQRLRRHSPAGR
jgi:hypothetical protein